MVKKSTSYEISQLIIPSVSLKMIVRNICIYITLSSLKQDLKGDGKK